MKPQVPGEQTQMTHLCSELMSDSKSLIFAFTKLEFDWTLESCESNAVPKAFAVPLKGGTVNGS